MQWANEMNAKRLKGLSPTLEPYDGLESDLHQKIIDYCKSMMWPYCRNRMDKKSTAQVGWPDLTICCRNGVTVFIEVKRKGGKPTPQQMGTVAWLQSLGHIAAFVWSYEEFLEKVRELK